MNARQLIVIQGPTASGKTALAIALAKRLNTVIFSADSRQFYREVAIGTAKPSVEEQDGVQHYFIDSHSITTPVSAAQFEKEAMPLLLKSFETHQQVILVGGSGLFIDAITKGLDDFPSDDAVQRKWQTVFENQGLDPLQRQVQKMDADFFNQMDQQNPHRLIRAIEIMELTGETMTHLHQTPKKTRPFEVKSFVLSPDRAALYARIDQRVHHMVAEGLIDEVKSVEHLRHLQSLNTVGYKEVFDYLGGNIDLDRAIELIQRNSRRYAKRQITWFKRNPDNIWIASLDLEERLQIIEAQIN